MPISIQVFVIRYFYQPIYCCGITVVVYAVAHLWSARVHRCIQVITVSTKHRIAAGAVQSVIVVVASP